MRRRRRAPLIQGQPPPLGAVACISPWNFPLSIFTGQVAAALAAGNAVLAKPAEETPLIAAQAVRSFTKRGCRAGAVQLLPGDGEVGAALVADPRVQGVMFTGSTEVARLIQRNLPGGCTGGRADAADRGDRRAERSGRRFLGAGRAGGADVLTSAFDSAGQRCSALRVLCLQEDVADRVLAMLKGAMAELAVGNPDGWRPMSARLSRRGARRDHCACRGDAGRGHSVTQPRCRPSAGTGPSCRRRSIEIGLSPT